MKLFCINLKRSHDRRVKMECEFARLSLPCEFIDAIDGRALTDAELCSVYAKWRALLRIGRELTRGEIGCVLSHLEFYRRVLVQKDGVGFVFEDDVSFDDDLPQALKLVEDRLSRTTEPMLVQVPGLPRDLPDNGSLRDLDGLVRAKSATGTYAYGVNRAAAQLLLGAFSRIRMPIDRYSYLVRRFGLMVYRYPNQALTVDMHGESTVGQERFCNIKNGIGKIVFKAWRALGVIADAVLPK